MKPTLNPPRRPARAQRGVTLIEALVALMVMSFGMVALVGLMANLRRGADIAKQRGEAMRIAQAEQARLRSFSVLTRVATDPVGTRDYETDVASLDTARTESPENSNASFAVDRTVQPLFQDSDEPRARTVSVRVAWQDRSDRGETLTLDSIVARVDPAFAGALGITPPIRDVRTPDSRNPVIPAGAKAIGDLSVFQPSSGSSQLWIFNNLSGVIVGKCELQAGQTLSALTAVDIESCNNNTVGYLVRGTIRFALGDRPDPAAPASPALTVSVSMNLTPSQFTIVDASREVVLAPGRDYPETPNHQCFSDAPPSATAAQPLVNYSCIVYPNTQTPRNWWGEVLLGGPSWGTSSTEYRACRYSADYNGNGRIDNEEHPASYSGVSYSLTRQNFLVVRGDVACPTAAAPDPANGIFVDYSTVQIQP